MEKHLKKIFYISIICLFILTVLNFISCNRTSSAKKTSKHSQTKIDFLIISYCLNDYETDNGTFPTTEQGLKALLEKPTSSPIPKIWHPYTDKIIDAWGHPYQYRYPSIHNMKFDLWSFGPDGKNETEDDIENWNPYKVYVSQSSGITLFDEGDEGELILTKYGKLGLIILLGIIVIIIIVIIEKKRKSGKAIHN